MIINKCNNFSVDGGIPWKIERYTSHTSCATRMIRRTVQFVGVYLHPPKNTTVIP